MGRPKIKDNVLAIDPFDICRHPTPAQKAWAEWFKGLINEGKKYHIREIHYQALGKTKPDGTTYENTINDAALLSKASEYARYLGLVDFDQIEDHKNEGVTVVTKYNTDSVNTNFRPLANRLTLPTINELKELIDTNDYTFGFYPICFDVQSRQPYHIEIWIEKSTINKAIQPIAMRYGATLVVAGGQFSITNVKDLFNRIKGLNKPVRIFYIRDFDPAGETMAKAVSRKLEWFIRNRCPGIDVQLRDIALTHEQCEVFKLPRLPMNKDEKYKNGFEEKYGEGATEIDSFVALHPDEFEKMVSNAIIPYYDESLRDVISEHQENELNKYREYKNEIVNEIVELKGNELAPMVNEFNRLVNLTNEYGYRIKAVIENIEVVEKFNTQYPEKSKRVVTDRNKKDILLDTTISYENQLILYQGGQS